MLSEMHRVTCDTLILSMWVDGNLKAWRRGKLEEKRVAREKAGYQNRFVIPVEVAEAEFSACGFDIDARLDFLPHYAMWRTYVLRKRPA
jgi:hypothetical protein